MPPEAAGVAEEIARDDERVRVFAFEKGPSNGEVHRHAVLHAHARGRVVLYLSDDDLWLPHHAAAMVAALADADFAVSTAALVAPDESVLVLPHDLGDPGYRALALSHERRWNHMPLSISGHTLEAYQRLETGWSSSPPEIWSDLYFYRRFLAEEWVQARSVTEVTCVNFPSSLRRDAAPAERAAELGAWAERLAAEEGRREFEARVAAAYRAHAVGSELLFEQAHDHARRLEAELERAGSELERKAELERELAAIRSSRTWRLRERARRALRRR
jgi:hypothetical protein